MFLYCLVWVKFSQLRIRSGKEECMFNVSLFFSTMQARDADKTSQLTYSVLDGNAKALFEIDKHSGEITVADPNGLDMSNVSADFVHLIVQVRIHLKFLLSGVNLHS